MKRFDDSSESSEEEEPPTASSSALRSDSDEEGKDYYHGLPDTRKLSSEFLFPRHLTPSLLQREIVINSGLTRWL